MHPLLKELERDNDPHDVLEIAPGVILAARAEPEFAALAPGPINRTAESPIQTRPSGAAAAPSLDATFRAEDHIAASGGRSSRGKKLARVLFVFLFALGSAAAAEAWRHYGDTAKAMLASWTPAFVATSSPPANAAPSAQPDATDVQSAQTPAPAAAPPQPTVPAQPADAVAPAAPPPDQTQSMAAMAQQIEQLKASIEQLKAGQEQMSRDIAKASEIKASEVRPPEPTVRPRIAAPKMAAPPRPAATLTRKPRPSVSAAPYLPPALPPAAAPPIAPQPVPEAQATETDGNPVVRPPLPVR
jgi:hypothetical protein